MSSFVETVMMRVVLDEVGNIWMIGDDHNKKSE